MQVASAGDRAVLVELGEVTAAELHGANDAVRRVAGVVRSTPGHSSLYVVFDGTPDREAVIAAISRRAPLATSAGTIHELRVAFDGEDLPEFLERTGLSRESFLARVDGLELVARYLGFRGGFAYLDGWPAEWAMPRRPTSRPVARGSFAIAGSVAAFYPIDSPGGWNLLGHTDADLENALAAGDRIVIRAVDGPLPWPGRKVVPEEVRSPCYELLSAPLAVWTTSPFDALAAMLANRAVGNDPQAAVLECPMVGPKVRARRDCVLAWCTPDLDVKTRRVTAGEEIAFGRVAGGLRAYLAAGEHETPQLRVDRGDRHRIRVMSGPHDLGWKSVECEVTPQLDRVGIRLRPLHALDAKIPADLRSIGMQCGTVQLHPDGSLLAMGPDHPVTGGYLQPMTVLSAETWKLAQLVPGERVKFEVE